jgi:hypothetical protein
MTLGYPQGKAQIDSKAGGLALTVRNALRDIVAFKAFLDGKTDAQLMDVSIGYTQQEVNDLRAAFTDLKKLSDIANAQATQPAASNFFFNAVKLYGVE